MRLRQTAQWSQVADGVIVLDTRTSKYTSLNHSAAALWVAFAGGAAEGQMEEVLIDQYGIDKPEAEKGVADFIALLRQHEFVEDE